MRKIPLTKHGLKPSWIVQSSTRLNKLRASNVAMAAIKATPNEFGLPTYTTQARSVRNDDGTARLRSPIYDVEVKVLDPKGNVEVSCTCMAHPYWGAEYSLTQRDAAVIKFGVNQAPDVRRPDWQTNASACKHVTAVLIKLINKGRLK